MQNKHFEDGAHIVLADGEEIEIQKAIELCEKRELYKIQYQGENKMFCWIKGEDTNVLYERIQTIVKLEAPSEFFCWPIAISEYTESGFGYVIKSLPEQFIKGSELVSGEKNKSRKSLILICMKLANLFGQMHKAGYVWGDFSLDMLYIDEQNIDVNIGAVENMMKEGSNANTVVTPGIIAPEIYSGKQDPSEQTDQYTLAAVIFELFCKCNPYDGEKWVNAPFLTEELVKDIYGENPIYIFDASNRSNAAVVGATPHAVKGWNVFPPYLKKAFDKAFIKEKDKEELQRLNESEWIQMLSRFYNMVYTCSCGKETVLKRYDGMVCKKCCHLIKISHMLIFPDYDIPVTNGGCIFAGQLGLEDEDPLRVIGKIKEDNGRFILANRSSYLWKGITPSGKEKEIKTDELVPVKDGIQIEIEGVQIKIKEQSAAETANENE